MRASKPLGLAASTVLALLCHASFAQTSAVMKSTCQGVGTNQQEPLGDRDGHGISVGQYSCLNEGGVMDGTIMTGTNIWEWNKGASVVLSGNGVIRRPGMVVVYAVTEDSNALTMADGKVTGFGGTAKGVYKLATGTAAPLAGKTFTSKVRSIGHGQFVIETTVD